MDMRERALEGNPRTIDNAFHIVVERRLQPARRRAAELKLPLYMVFGKCGKRA
jgi:hypothetical protein